MAPQPAGLVRPMVEADWPAVRDIYQAGIDTGDATFETAAPSTWASFDTSRLPGHRFVAAEAGRVVGWIAVSPVSTRAAYAGVVEHSVYVDPATTRRAVGRTLLAALTESTEAAGIWTIQSAIFPENVASLRLHDRAGFRVVGHRERIARQHGVWRDVLLLERRSPAIS